MALPQTLCLCKLHNAHTDQVFVDNQRYNPGEGTTTGPPLSCVSTNYKSAWTFGAHALDTWRPHQQMLTHAR
jgi:hypothetical protein